jgi:hypothetical protein
MGVKEDLHRLVDRISAAEAACLLELMEHRSGNPLLHLAGIIASGRSDGAEHHLFPEE